MAAEAARKLDFEEFYSYGSAAPAREPFAIPEPKPAEIPELQEQPRAKEKQRGAASVQQPAISMFALLGSALVVILMLFVLLGQISFNEAASETVRLNAQLNELMDQQRRLEIVYESIVDMKEIERYARDELGMSRPDTDQVTVIQSAPGDRVEILKDGEDEQLVGFGSFISSLLEHLR